VLVFLFAADNCPPTVNMFRAINGFVSGGGIAARSPVAVIPDAAGDTQACLATTIFPVDDN
jgi:hypothetical protein